MTLKTTIAGHVSSVFLNEDHFAESIAQYPAGDMGDPQTISGVLEIEPTLQENDDGRGQLTRGKLLLLDSVTVDDDDQYVIDGVTWHAETIGEKQDGARIVGVLTYDSTFRTSSGRTRSGR